MAAFSKVYQHMEALREFPDLRCPQDVKDELLWGVFLLPVAHANIRWPLSSRLSCTDATPVSGGSVSCEVTPGVARALYRLAEHRGEQVRLDWDGLQCLTLPSRMSRPSAFTDSLVAALPWKLERQYSFKQLSHVNLQELRAIKTELKVRVSEKLRLGHASGGGALTAPPPESGR